MKVNIRGNIMLNDDPKTKVQFQLESGTHYLAWNNSINKALDVAEVLAAIQEVIDKIEPESIEINEMGSTIN
tara:strand:- start:1105 stop:1320 length:216 start_codon:yes stop_codon:yes gene_type:complete